MWFPPFSPLQMSNSQGLCWQGMVNRTLFHHTRSKTSGTSFVYYIPFGDPTWLWNALDFFPTSLCGALVFRFAPAASASACARPAATCHLTHHSTTHHTVTATSSHSTHHCTTYHISLITPQLITAPLLTSHSSHHNSSQLHLLHHLSHLTHHTTTHHSSTYCTTYHISLITPQLITAPLLTPHSSHHNPSQLHFSHLTHHSEPSRRSFWARQYTEPYKEPPGGAARAWAPLGRGCLSCGRRSTQSLLQELVGGAGARVGAAGLWLALVWQARYTEPSGGAAACVGAAGPGWLSCGRPVHRRAFLEELVRF